MSETRKTLSDSDNLCRERVEESILAIALLLESLVSRDVNPIQPQEFVAAAVAVIADVISRLASIYDSSPEEVKRLIDRLQGAMRDRIYESINYYNHNDKGASQ
jgi:archaellum component FlaC